MKDKEMLKLELLEELKKEYKLVPIKEPKFQVKYILDKYIEEICIKRKNYENKDMVQQSIRQIVCLHFGYNNLNNVPKDKRSEFIEELERFIKEYILCENN